MRKAIAPGEILKDKRVLIGGAGILVAGAAAAAFYAFGNQQTTVDESAPPVVTQAPAGGGPGSPGNPGAPGRPGGAATVGGPAGGTRPGTPRPKPSASPAATLALERTTSFDNIPKGIPGGSATGTPVQGQPAPAAPATTVAASDKPAPIRQGVTAPGSRIDPFVSRLIEPFQRPAAYLFAEPIRLAGRPVPPRPPRNENPDLQFGPLPFVQRRVAGILYNGQVSAILETGGAGTGVSQVVQPGARVPSGIPGIDDLTVDTITPTSLTLRAQDGRTTAVALSAAPEGSLPNLGGGATGGGPPATGGGGRGGDGGPVPMAQ